MSDQPEWVRNAPQTPLEEKVKGKRYHHSIICSADPTKPLGSPGCICLKLIANGIGV
jgi:hypothetical protein